MIKSHNYYIQVQELSFLLSLKFILSIIMDIDEFLNDSFEDALRPRDSNTPEADLQALTRAWVNERGAPEILPLVLTYFSPPSTTSSVLRYPYLQSGLTSAEIIDGLPITLSNE